MPVSLVSGASPPAPASDLGVLFVHGIGRQRRTQTLARCAIPLCDAVGRWAASVGSTGRMIQITGPDAWPSALRSEAAISVETQYSPASVAFVFTESQDGRERHHRWLLAESLWARSQDFPRDGEFAKWLLGLIRRVLNGLCIILCDRLRQKKRSRYDRRTIVRRFPHDRYSNTSCRTRRNIWSAKAALVSLIGDCLAGCHDLQVRDALLDMVNADLVWLSSRCDRVVVIAHSLGAAIAADVLGTRGLPDNLALLVTYGASIPKRHRIPVDGPPNNLSAKPSFAAMGASPNSAHRAALGVSIPWLDFAADRDPFAGPPAPQSVHTRICNERSLFTDHWAYWRNTEEFVIPVIAALVQAEASTP